MPQIVYFLWQLLRNCMLQLQQQLLLLLPFNCLCALCNYGQRPYLVLYHHPLANTVSFM